MEARQSAIAITQPSELVTVVGVITILVVMIIPLPALLLDFLLALNITLAITI